MNDPFSQMIETLCAGRQAIRDDLERYSKSSVGDPGRLTGLLKAVRSLAAQADSLLDTMIERDPLNSRIAEVEDLLEFFLEAEMQIAGLLEVGRE